MTVYTGQLFPSVTPLGVGQITTLEVVTESVLPGETLEFELDTPQSYQINSIATSSPCWLRVYGTSYARSLDTRTSPGSPFPEAGSGFFAEIQTVQGNLTTSFAPTAEVQVENTSTLFKVRNDDGSPREITITLDVIVSVYPVVPSSPPYNCSTSVDTRGQVDLSNAWKDCDPLTHLPLFDLSSATNLESAWENCTRLVYVPPGLFDNCPAANFTNVFVNCSLSPNSVDNILISLDEAGVENGIVDITGGNNAPPTVAGLAAKTILEGKGWTVNVVPSPGVSFVDLGVGEECYAATSFEDGRVFVGTNSGNVFVSADYGVTFDTGTLVGNGTIYNIAACNGDTVIAGTYADSFPFVTTDGGLTWGPGEDFAESEIDSVAYAGSNTVYIGTYGYIHKSTDNGQTWEPGTSPYGNDYYISLVFPGVDKVVAGSYTNGFISYSTDGGLTWDTTSDYVLGGGEAIYGLASNGGGIVVAGTTEGGKVFLSTDSGVNWDGGTQLGGATEVYTLLCSETGVFYAGTNDDGKIYCSYNNGETWQEFFDPGITGGYVYSLCRGGNNTLIAGIDTFVYSIPYQNPSQIPGTQVYPVFSSPTGNNAVISDTTGITGAFQVRNIVSITQDDYNNIPAPDPETLYLIIP